jgi:hypothetical protein
MTVHRYVFVVWTAALLVVALPAAAQVEAPRPPVAAKPGEKAEKPTPARRGREPPRKDAEERPRPDVAVSFPADI